MNVSYRDIIKNATDEPQRTSEEIIASVKANLKGMR